MKISHFRVHIDSLLITPINRTLWRESVALFMTLVGYSLKFRRRLSYSCSKA
jgi:hypothetical protein